MKKSLLLIVFSVILIQAGAQEPRTRVKRTTGTEQSTGTYEGQANNYQLFLSSEQLELFEKGDNAILGIKKSGNAEVGEVEWISANPKVARVSSKGNVTPVASGKTVIYAQDANGTKSNECTVTVSEPKKWGSYSGKDNLSAQNEWIYFANRADNNKLYKVMRNGQYLTRLSDDQPRYLNVSGNKIYYYNTNIDTRTGLYRLTSDGEKRTLLNDRDQLTTLMVNKDGFAFYVAGEKDIFAHKTMSANAPIDKLFDTKSVYSMVVNDDQIVYNHIWADGQYLEDGGGLFIYNRETKKKEVYFSGSRNTSHLILDDQEKKVYVCIYKHEKVALDLVPDIFEKKESNPSGWFSLDISYDPQKEAFKEAQKMRNSGMNSSASADLMLEKWSKLKKLSLTENDMILFVHDGWIYYTRDSMLRRIKTNMKLDQELFACGKEHGLTTDGEFLYYWTPENKLFRRVMDGRFAKEIIVKQ